MYYDRVGHTLVVTATMFNESKDQIVEKAVSQYLTHNRVRQVSLCSAFLYLIKANWDRG
jgi:hypothetical protein